MEDSEVSDSPNKLDEALQKSKKCLSNQDKKSETYLDMYVKSIAKSDDSVHVSGGGSRKSQERHLLKGNAGGLNLRKSTATEEKSDEETTPSNTTPLTNGRTWKHTDVFHSPKLNRRPLHPEVNNDSNSIVSSTTTLTKQEGSSLTEEIGEKFAVCPNCGSLSKNFSYCDSCQKVLPKGVKTYTRTPMRLAKYVMAKKSFYGNSGISAVFTKTEVPSRVSYNSSKMHENQLNPPECLTISSDDDDEQGKSEQVNNEDFQLRKERMLDAMGSIVSHTSQYRKIVKEEADSGGIGGGGDDDAFSIKPSLLQCRSVRIGSFKFIPPSKVQVSTKGIYFSAPMVFDKKEEVHLQIDSKDIVRVMCHFGRSLPLLFIYTTPGCGNNIRSRLQMSKDGPYYDPGSEDETQKRITLLPDRISDEQRVTLRNIFTEIGRIQGVENKSIMYEIDSKTANEILVRSTPAEVKKMVKLLVTSPPFATKIQTTPSGEQEVILRTVRTVKAEPKTVVKMMVYPPFPQTGGITITSEDFACLQEGEFLNDVIIDFYLRYLVQYKLLEADRRRTHVFSSFFYRRLTQKPTRRNAYTEDSRLSASEIRHNRVKTWTRHVDIFSKDFIVIPINENAHWFLAVICFPYLDGPTSMKKKELETEQEDPVSESSETMPSMSEENDDPLMDVSSTVQDPETQEDSMDSCTPDETLFDSTIDEPCQSQSQETILTPNPIMQPCILIFDSLPGPNRGKIVSTLREYLRIEWKVKKLSDRSFDKERMKGCTPKVPQQTNFSDCGIYLLQYVESFFENPIRDYSVPIKGLKDWFAEDIVNKKRAELRELIKKLMIEQHGRNLLEDISLTPIPFINNSEQSTETEQTAETNSQQLPVSQESKTPITQEESSDSSNSRS